jgi:hypothetical protein
VLCRPFENVRIIRTRQRHVLHAQDVQPRASAHDATEDVVIEVFVDQQANAEAWAMRG